MLRVKNLQAGVLIVADAVLKLGPGEERDVAVATPQIDSAVEAGLLARVDTQPEVKQRSRSTGRGDHKVAPSAGDPPVTASAADSGDDGDAL